MSIVTRFAPSPTGYLHIGSARTALFNYLYAKHHNGKFLLRIEDTDKKRSTDDAIEAIFSGMKWLGLNWDEDPIYQSKNIEQHQQVAKDLIAKNKAYYCYCSKEKLQKLRDECISQKKTYKYDGTCRNLDKNKVTSDIQPVVRLKSPQDGQTIINDLVQGTVTIDNSQQDDIILLRQDGTPTYMLAVVVDDFNMGVTDVIRGDDHLTNSFRQKLIYDAMGWPIPNYAHIPLIHGGDGAKLSKRHGALGVDAYKDMGYLPSAMQNYLLRLGWSHNNDEIINQEKAIKWFNIENIGKSPARFDFSKLDNLNGYYIRALDNESLFTLIEPILIKKLGKITGKDRIIAGMDSLKQRANLITQLADNAIFYTDNEIIKFSDKAQKSLDTEGLNIIAMVIDHFNNIDGWTQQNIENSMRALSEQKDLKLNKIMAPLRAAITGSHMSPSMFEAIAILGKELTFKRLKAVL